MTAEPKVIKKIIHAGKKYIPLFNESRVHFHFQTWRLSPERVLLDDSRKIGKCEPMTLVIGHKFKLEVWEEIVKKMAVGEIASFIVKRELVSAYPFVSKTLRDNGKNIQHSHSCAMTIQTEGLGYEDLDKCLKNPSDLEFIIEIVKVEQGNEYERDEWQLDPNERLARVSIYKEEGNNYFKEKDYISAEESYAKAIGICERLILREKKNDEEWVKLTNMKLPILLNYAQCKLIQGDFYPVIEHCSEVLLHDPTNEKALFRRAKAHVGAWNPQQAEDDFQKLRTINPKLSQTIDKELANIKKMRNDKKELDKEAMQKLFIKE